jgi:DNA-binding MarR family transcriptional regulator
MKGSGRGEAPLDERAVDLGIVDALVQLSFTVQSVLARVADGYELSLIQVRLLGVLRDREPGMLELASFLNLDKSSVTGLVDRAERRGLVRRTTPPEDRRTVHVALTDRGRELARAFAAQVERDLVALVEPLSTAERKRLSVLASRAALGDAGAGRRP